jgi:catechol 2,3-dioxygenase-like lactoylglutathione lyase family enzyme
MIPRASLDTSRRQFLTAGGLTVAAACLAPRHLIAQTSSIVPGAFKEAATYFEIREVDDFCRKLQGKGFYITQMPRMMPWGWRHAYLNDPDGHEISIYWAGENRMKKTVMRAAKEVEQAPSAKGR